MSDNEEPIVEEDQALQQYLGTTSFGKQSKEAAIDQQIERSRREASRKQLQEKANQSKSDKDSDDDDSDEDDEDDEEFPVSHEMVLKTHDRAVTAATIDPSGARLITGSMDCTLKLHDFASMTPTTIRAFKSVDPTAAKGGSSNVEGHPVHQVAFNPIYASHMLVCTALPQAKVMTRDGESVAETAKGDMYLRDMHNTKGHISEITTGVWHPTRKELFVTAGTDSTLRIWDVNNTRSQKDVIVHKSRAAGSAGRTRMTAVAWGSQAQGGQNVLVSAALDGSLVMWQGEGPYSRPAGEIRDAHEPNTWTSGVDISADGRLVATRGGDDTIKLWDTRKFKSPITTTSHPSTSSQYPTSSIRFSPNSSQLLTGSPTGDLHILNPATLRPELITPITPGHTLITAQWHPKLNQILTTSSNGATHLLYSPTHSTTSGAKAVFQRAPKQRHIDDDATLTSDIAANGLSSAAIIVPGANGGQQNPSSYSSRHPEVGLTASGRSRDPRRPHKPAVTPFAKGQPDEKYVKEQIPLSSLRDEDPREALLRYAEKGRQEGKEDVFTAAWSQTQPKGVYAELSDDEEGEGEREEGRPAKKARSG
ncbi:hypothetical protein MBLNU230_g2756t1 [Neophaeotheca triangularis]